VDIVVVVKIGASNHGSILANANSLDTSGTFFEFKLLFLLTSTGVPNKESGSGADLARDSPFSHLVHIYSKNIVVVTIFIVTSLLGLVLNLSTTKEFLGVLIMVKDNTKSGSHVDNLTVLVEEDVLARVSASVTINVLKSVSLIRLVVVDGVVIIRLSNLTNPGLNSHELFTFASIFDSEHFIIDTVLALANLAGLFVELGTSTVVVVKFLIVIVVSGRGIRSP